MLLICNEDSIYCKSKPFSEKCILKIEFHLSCMGVPHWETVILEDIYENIYYKIYAKRGAYYQSQILTTDIVIGYSAKKAEYYTQSIGESLITLFG